VYPSGMPERTWEAGLERARWEDAERERLGPGGPEFCAAGSADARLAGMGLMGARMRGWVISRWCRRRAGRRAAVLAVALVVLGLSGAALAAGSVWAGGAVRGAGPAAVGGAARRYPDILPASGGGCWPVVPVAAGDVGYLRDTEMRLNAMLASVAAANGATYVDTYRATAGHDVCQPPAAKDIEGLIPTSLAFPFHPNERGDQVIAGQVLAALRTHRLLIPVS